MGWIFRGLVFSLLFLASPVWAASYLDVHGVVHDPIQDIYGDDSFYSGNNLEPGADLTDADLEEADLPEAALSQADLSDSYLVGANLSGADLTSANLTWADLSEADLSNADLSSAVFVYADLLDTEIGGADFSNSLLYAAWLDDTINWSSATWTGARYSLNAVDNDGNLVDDTLFPAGMDQAWRDAAGMVAVPEPTTALLLGLGLIGLSKRRRDAVGHKR